MCSYFVISLLLFYFSDRRGYANSTSTSNETLSYLNLTDQLHEVFKKKMHIRFRQSQDFRPHMRVKHGQAAALGEVPYQVSLKEHFMTKNNSEYFGSFCGGSLLSANKVVTAAHCFVEDQTLIETCLCSGYRTRDLNGVFVVAGLLDNYMTFPIGAIKGPGQWRKILNVTFPETYVFPVDDILIIFTNKPFLLDTNVAIIPYARKTMDYIYGPCYISGYGLNESGKPSQKLMRAPVNVSTTAACSKKFRENLATFVCMPYGLVDIGQGDSGGPLVCFNTSDAKEGDMGLLVGVTCGIHPEQRGSLFTRVSRWHKYLDANESNAAGPRIFYIMCVFILMICL